jgi:multiple sugar transport system permease protein
MAERTLQKQMARSRRTGAGSSIRISRTIADVITYGLLALISATMVLPFVWMVVTSFKPATEVLTTVGRLYTLNPTLEHYRKLLTVSRFDRYYLNSIFVASAVTVGQIVTSSFAGFAFARLEFPGREKLLAGYVATMMVPFAVRMVPTFIIVRWLGWVDTYWALIVPLVCGPYNTFLFRQFYRTLPEDLVDAARLDGCGNWGVYRHVMLPLSRAMMAAVGTITFLWSWRSFLWPLIVTNTKQKMVIAVALSRLVDEMVMDWGLLMAATSVAMVPTLVVFIFAQEQIVKSITLTGMKA